MRPGVMSMIRALPCVPVVMMPACEPVSERACSPWSAIAMASSAALIRSPAVSSMSSSRGGGCGETWRARSISSSVVSPIAEMTTTTSWPCCLVATTRLATRLMLSASATDEPPYFCTTLTLRNTSRAGRERAPVVHGRAQRSLRVRPERAQRWTKTATVRPGTVNVPSAAVVRRRPHHRVAAARLDRVQREATAGGARHRLRGGLRASR